MAIVRGPSNIEALSDDEHVALQQRQPAAIDTLSDDEVLPAISEGERRKYSKRKSLVLRQDEIVEHRRRLRIATDRNCTCKIQGCRAAWRESQAELQQLLDLRLEIHQLPKMDADHEVPLNLIK